MKNANNSVLSKTFSILTILTLVFSVAGVFPMKASAHAQNLPFRDGRDHYTNIHDEYNDRGDNRDHDGDKDDNDQPLAGSIKVCKIMLDSTGAVIDGTNLTSTFTISGGAVPAGSYGHALTSTILNTPLTFTDNFLGGDAINDATCVTYPGLKMGAYYYGAETVSNPTAWEIPKYSDQYSKTITSVADFYTLNGTDNGFNADGVINLTSTRPNRTLVVLNKLKAPVQPPVTPLTCDTGFHVVSNQCVANVVIVPESTAITPATVSGNNNGNSLVSNNNSRNSGGHRHIFGEVLGASASIYGNSSSGGDLQQKLLALMNQLLQLLQKYHGNR